MWLGRAILENEQPFHPLGLAYTGAEDNGMDMSVFLDAIEATSSE